MFFYILDIFYILNIFRFGGLHGDEVDGPGDILFILFIILSMLLYASICRLSGFSLGIAVFILFSAQIPIQFPSFPFIIRRGKSGFCARASGAAGNTIFIVFYIFKIFPILAHFLFWRSRDRVVGKYFIIYIFIFYIFLYFIFLIHFVIFILLYVFMSVSYHP